MMARVDDDAIRQAENSRRKPWPAMPSTPMRENAAASAALDPEMPPNTIVPATVALPTPPGMRPIHARAPANRRSIRPPATKNSAVRMKSGTAMSV